ASTTQLSNSGAIPAEGMALPFKPFIWLGWQDGGLSWFCESAKSWQPQDKNLDIDVVRDGETVTLRLRLLDGVLETWRGNRDGWFHPNTPLTFSWGLQATPVKPLEENALEYRIVHFSNYEELTSYRIEQETHKNTEQTVLDRAIEAGANVVILHEQWNSIQNYWVNSKTDEIKATVTACHAQGLKILPYFGYELSTLAPEWAKFHDKVLVKGADDRFFGGWNRLPPQRDYIVCYASEWQEKWLAGIEWMMEEYGFDGVYLDGTSMPWACANAAHDCGYEENGERHETYPIWEVRRLYQRLYDIVSARDGIITTHQSSCCVTPTLAYSHTYWDGEHISGLKPDENDEFPFATFQAEFMGRPFGIQAEFLSDQPGALAYALIHNVLVRPNIGELLDSVAPIWKAFTEFGTPEATWLPYWKNAAFVPEDAPHVRVSAYLREGKVLLVVANLSAAENVNATIRITPDAGREFSTARDIISKEILSLDNGRIQCSCNAMGWRLVELKI
ncbi:MAG: glycoside hydrolase domain-containing protein, partial [Abditibacteriaceae bacterium]